jgi:hypothetical protein
MTPDEAASPDAAEVRARFTGLCGHIIRVPFTEATA